MEAVKLCQAAQKTLQTALPQTTPFALRGDGCLIVNLAALSPVEIGSILAKHGSLEQVEGKHYRLPPCWQDPIPGTDLIQRALQIVSNSTPLPQQPCVRADGSVVFAIQDELVALSEFFFAGCSVLGRSDQRPHPLVVVQPAIFAKLLNTPANGQNPPLEELLANPPSLLSRDSSPKRQRPYRARTQRLSLTDEHCSPERPALGPPTHGLPYNAELKTVLHQLRLNGHSGVEYNDICAAIERSRELERVSLTTAPIEMLAEALWISDQGPTRPTIERLARCVWEHFRVIEEPEFLWHLVFGGRTEQLTKLLSRATCRSCGGFRKALRPALPHVWSAHVGSEFSPKMPVIPTLSGLILDTIKPSREDVALLLAEKRPLLPALGVHLPGDVQDLKTALCRCRCSFCHQKKDTKPIDLRAEWFPACKACLLTILKSPKESRDFWTFLRPREPI